MIFVNNIGDIVHSMVDRFMGAANKVYYFREILIHLLEKQTFMINIIFSFSLKKNIGDAFLLVWKFKEDKYTVMDDNTINYLDPEYASIMAEFALFSFMKIHAKMNREPLILEYRNDKRLN